MNNKFEKLLKEYNGNIKFIQCNEIENYSLYISKKWIDIFKEDNMNKRIEKTLNIWKNVIFKELNETIKYMENHLIDVSLITYDKKYYVLYTMNNDENNIFYVGGNLNIDFGKNTFIENNWGKIPKKLVDFYTNIHNGFYDFIYNFGLLEISDIVYFYDHEDYWIEDLEEYEKHLDINIQLTFGLFYNGNGDYVAVDISKSEDIGFEWYHDDVEYSDKIKFWGRVDEWMVSFFIA